MKTCSPTPLVSARVSMLFGTAAQAHMLDKFVAEELHTADNRARRRVAQGAKRLASQIIADVEQQIDILLLALAVLQAMQDLRQPVRALAAGRAFAAGLVAVEFGH